MTPAEVDAARAAMPALLAQTLALAERWLASLPERPVGPRAGVADLTAALGGPLPDAPSDPAAVIAALAAGAEPGLSASPGPRYFGFVTGGSLPVSVAADWLTAAWDQNGALFAMSPAAAVVEDVVAGWLRALFGLPTSASVGLVTGAQMANVTGLAAARHEVLRRAGWSVADDGLVGAPPLRVVVGGEAHVTLWAALRLLGIGNRAVRVADADAQGRMRADAVRAALADADGPTIVCAQAGNVNSGASDPLEALADATAARPNAWLHVDGAFGMWAAVSPALRDQVRGIERADSWATDGHKWLNVPYDSGIVATAHPAAHAAAMGRAAAYLTAGADGERNGMAWAPESSRRVRAFALWAALRALGRDGVVGLVERCCALALRMAERLRAGGLEILNDVTLNQVLARVPGADELTDAAVARIQADGTCWLGGTRWQGRAALRISVSNWSTTEADIDRAAAAILTAAHR